MTTIVSDAKKKLLAMVKKSLPDTQQDIRKGSEKDL